MDSDMELEIRLLKRALTDLRNHVAGLEDDVKHMAKDHEIGLLSDRVSVLEGDVVYLLEEGKGSGNNDIP